MRSTKIQVPLLVRLRGNASFISLLNWTEVGLKRRGAAYLVRCSEFFGDKADLLSTSKTRPELDETPALGAGGLEFKSHAPTKSL
jgi:hypothetical protein